MDHHKVKNSCVPYDLYYSLFTLLVTQSTTNALIYADIGQSSIRHQQNQSTSTHLLDDSVEYAQLNHNVNLPIHSKASKTNVEPAKNSMISEF
jgi:hypothetical protein